MQRMPTDDDDEESSPGFSSPVDGILWQRFEH
jgi:hypothetical protein